MIAGGCGEDTERVARSTVPLCSHRLGVMVSRNVRGQSVAYLDIPCLLHGLLIVSLSSWRHR
jgi:hypothetical protein